MLLFPLAAVVGAALAWHRGGRLGNLGGVALRAPLLVWAAVAIQVWLGVTGPMAWPFGGRFVVLVVTYLAVGVWLMLNAAGACALRFGFGVLGLGWLLNLAAIVPNGGMPVARSALEEIAISSDVAIDEGHLGKHVSATSSSTFAWLGDVIPARPLQSVISIGDVVMSAGMAWGTFRVMLPRSTGNLQSSPCRQGSEA